MGGYQQQNPNAPKPSVENCRKRKMSQETLKEENTEQNSKKTVDRLCFSQAIRNLDIPGW